MKKIVFATIMSLVLLSSLQAQDKRQKHKERIESMKVGFITQQLDLSPQESTVFWPIYNQYQKQLVELRQQRNKSYIDISTDEEARDFLVEKFKMEQTKLNIQKEMSYALADKIPIQKVAKLAFVEHKFKQQILEKAKRKLKNKKKRQD